MMGREVELLEHFLSTFCGRELEAREQGSGGFSSSHRFPRRYRFLACHLLQLSAPPFSPEYQGPPS